VGSRLKRLLTTILKFAVTAAALYFVIRKVDVAQVKALYGQASLVMLAGALAAFALSKLISAFRLNLYFRAIGIIMNEKANTRLYLLGMFYNLFLPGGIGGDGYKVYLLQKKYQSGTKKLIGAVLADRISGMVALAVLSLAGISLLDAGPGLSVLNFTFILIPFAFLAYYLFIRYIYPYFLKINLATFGYGFAVQLLQLICAGLLLLALGETDDHLSYLVIFLVSSVIAVLPISVGGVGVRELTFLYGSQLLNIDMNIAVGISFLFYLVTAVVSLPGIYFVFRPKALRLSD
jgi:hypothetical protein